MNPKDPAGRYPQLVDPSGERWAPPPSQNVDKVETLTVLRVEFKRGLGLRGSAIRRVTQFWSLEGELLVENDPLPDDPSVRVQ